MAINISALFKKFVASFLQPNLKLILILGCCMACPGLSYSQDIVSINPSFKQHIFSHTEIESLADPTGSLTFREVSSPNFIKKFKACAGSTPQVKANAVSWFRIKIAHAAKLPHNKFLLEFFDQTIDDITAYLPQSNGYRMVKLGDKYNFTSREIKHKNFEILLDGGPDTTGFYYFRIQSTQNANVIIVLRSVNWFVAYALTEYLTFGIFYGMILIFCFYNLVMFIYLRRLQYFYYVLYILSIGWYEMCIDGIAYQYLWPNSPKFNQDAYAFALCCMSIFALLFTQTLLHVKVKAPKLNLAINIIIVLRVIAFTCFYFFWPSFLRYKFMEAIPLIIAFSTGLYIYIKGYRPARYFVIGYAVVFLGFLLKFMVMLGWVKLNHWGIVSYYSLSFCFIVEMFFLSLSIGDSLRLLKRTKEEAQLKIIKQLRINEQLKDNLNKKLEAKVLERSREIVVQSTIITEQNRQLKEMNDLLIQQSDEISSVNALLEVDNAALKQAVEKITRDRVMSAEVEFSEFNKVYPDKESCFKFLAKLKWDKEYQCKKCGAHDWLKGTAPFSRRCLSCNYSESVMIGTLFENTRIPIDKAFYMVFLVYSTKGKISSHRLSEILQIRQNTCWIFATKIKTIMNQRGKELVRAGSEGWSKLILVDDKNRKATLKT
jgi:hypothetical protein